MHLFFCVKLSVKKITIYAKLSGEKNQIGKVFVYHCSGKISANKMNEKKNFVQWFKNDNPGTIFAYRKAVH